MAINIENLREIIQANRISARELGFKPQKDTELIEQIRNVIEDCVAEEDARRYFSEKYWEDLGIAKKKYQIVQCEMRKVIYKNIYIAMPDGKNANDAENYIGSLDNLDNEYPDDEEDWELYDANVDMYELTAEDVKLEGQDKIWNYCDFED